MQQLGNAGLGSRCAPYGRDPALPAACACCCLKPPSWRHGSAPPSTPAPSLPLAALPAGPEFELSARVPDPWRLVRAYNQSAATLNLLRGFATGGYAGLDRVTKWSLDFMKVGGRRGGREG